MGPLFDNNKWILKANYRSICLRLLELPPEIVIITSSQQRPYSFLKRLSSWRFVRPNFNIWNSLPTLSHSPPSEQSEPHTFWTFEYIWKLMKIFPCVPPWKTILNLIHFFKSISITVWRLLCHIQQRLNIHIWHYNRSAVWWNQNLLGCRTSRQHPVNVPHISIDLWLFHLLFTG